MKPKFLLCLALVVSGVLPGFSAVPDRTENGSGSSTNDWQTKAIASEADLDRVIGQLQIPSTRFDAMVALLDFAGYPKGNIGNHDLKVNALHDKAITAMHTCPGLDAVVAIMTAGLKEPNKRLPMIEALLKVSGGFGGMPGYRPWTRLEKLMSKASKAASKAFDVPTVERALGDPDSYLRLAAVSHFGNPPGEIGEWKRLLPRVEELGAGDGEDIRLAVARKLQRFPGTAAFLAGRETNETSPGVLLALVGGRYVGKEFENHFLTLFVPLLSSRDEHVREGALSFVGGNSSAAPMWQIPFGTNVFERVIASTKAKSAKERSMAAYALTAIRQINPDRSRKTFLHLVNDPDEDVRWRVAGGLAGQLEREDVKRAIAALLKDNSPMVRYETIVLAVGPEKCILELEQLSKGSDPFVADMAAKTLNGIMTRSGVAFCGEIDAAAQNGDLKKVRALLRGKPDLVFSKDGDGWTPLHWASFGGHKEIAELLLANRAKVNAKDLSGSTPLHSAASGGHKDFAELLLANGAEVNAKDLSGKTPLHLAAENGHKDVVRLLLANKAEVNAKDKDEYAPLHYAEVCNQKEVVELLLAHGGEVSIHWAAAGGDLEKVKALLKDNPDLVHSEDDEGKTPLHWAAWKGHRGVTELLLANKADVNAKDEFDKTPLHDAAAQGHKDVAELLLANKADVNAKDSFGETPLYLAAFGGHMAVAELLLASKAEVNAKDNNGQSPLYLAASGGHKDVAELLRQHGGHE